MALRRVPVLSCPSNIPVSPSLPPIRSLLEQRAWVRSSLRHVFESRGFLEVDTPVLSSEVLPEAYIDPIGVQVDGPAAPPHYLQASPEALMKRMLAQGAGAIYQFARSFRAGERGKCHDVEFVLLEWYAPGTTLDDSALLLESLCHHALGTAGIDRFTCTEAFGLHAGIAPLSASLADWQAAGRRLGVAAAHGQPESVDGWFELLLSEVVGPNLGHQRPALLEAWPVSQAAFAKVDQADARVARRFELFVKGVELANGWEEDTSREVLLERIDAANGVRVGDGRGALPLPEKLLAAHGEQMPQGVGAALGFDRLVMLAAGATTIDAIRPFSSRTA